LRERVSILILSSDGKTPDEVAKQILQIHAILPGQKPERQFNIPIRSSTQQTNTDSRQLRKKPFQRQSLLSKRYRSMSNNLHRSNLYLYLLPRILKKELDSVAILKELRS
jgi:hypothetical protein